jgi:hypothetical protein
MPGTQVIGLWQASASGNDGLQKIGRHKGAQVTDSVEN